MADTPMFAGGSLVMKKRSGSWLTRVPLNVERLCKFGVNFDKTSNDELALQEAHTGTG